MLEKGTGGRERGAMPEHFCTAACEDILEILARKSGTSALPDFLYTG
jgi:hypothetical protein